MLELVAVAAALAVQAEPAAKEKKHEDEILVTGRRLPSGAVEVQGRPGGSVSSLRRSSKTSLQFH